MNDSNQAREWDEAACHLVRAHGADPDRLLSIGLPLNKLLWVHFDTHAALEIAGLQPPAGHLHPGLRDPDLDARPDDPESFSPLRTAPSSPTPAPTFWARFYADSSYTGLPQTGMCPPQEAGDVTGRWASMAITALGGYFAAGCPEADYCVAGSPAARAVLGYFSGRGQVNVTAARRSLSSGTGSSAAPPRSASARGPGWIFPQGPASQRPGTPQAPPRRGSAFRDVRSGDDDMFASPHRKLRAVPATDQAIRRDTQ